MRHALSQLQNNDVFCLWAFLTLSHNELYALTFSQSFEASALDLAEMREHIWTRFLFDKTKTFSFVEPFNFADFCIRHGKYLY